MIRTLMKYAAAMAAMLAMAACGGDDSFRILGDVDELGTQNLRFVYLSGGQLQTATSTAVDGQFSFEGRSDQPTMVEVYTNASTLIGRLVVRNGETVKCRFALSDPWKMSAEGNGDSERLAKFLTDNHDILAGADRAAVNEKISEFVGKNKDRLASAVLLSRYYFIEGYQAQADSLMGLLGTKARPAQLAADFYNQTARTREVPDTIVVESIKVLNAKDSLLTISASASPKSLFVFTRAVDRRSDSVAALMGSAGNGVKVVDVSLDPDTATWRRSMALVPDTLARVSRVWAIGGEASPTLAPLRVYRTPMFVLVDSTGHVRYSGHDIESLRQKINGR